MTINKKRIKKFKEMIKDVEPIKILAQPVHGSHAKPNENTIIKEATEKASFGSWAKDGDELTNKHKSLYDHYTKYHNDHKTENRGIYSYTSHSYRINKHLREDTLDSLATDPIKENVNRIDEHLKNAPPLHEDTEVYHGIGDWHPGMESFKHPDRQIQLPSYTSTSISKSMAGAFSSGSSNKNTTSNHVLKIKLKKGQRPGSYVDPISLHEGEHEFLIHRNAKFRIERKPEIYQKGKHDFGDGTKHRGNVYVWTAHYLDDHDTQ